MKLYFGDSEEVLKSVPDHSVDSIVCDPPYGLHLMKKGWDKTLPSIALWKECYRVLKPGAYIMAMSSARTYHHLAVLMEKAGFITHPMLGWIFSSGMPKGADLARQLDIEKEEPDEAFRVYLKSAMKAKGLTIKKMNELCGFKGMFCHFVGKSQSLYPSPKHWDRIKEVLELDNRYDSLIYRHNKPKDLTSVFVQRKGVYQFRKKIKDYVPKTDLGKKWKGYRYGLQSLKPALEPIYMGQKPMSLSMKENILAWGVGAVNIDACRIPVKDQEALDNRIDEQGRYPANVLHDGRRDTIEAMECYRKEGSANYFNALSVDTRRRFFYVSKPSQKEKGAGNRHPTVKPIKLMEHLVKLITPVQGVCLDPFMGSGTTGIAALRNNFAFMGVEKEEGYFEMARNRLMQARFKWSEENKKKEA